MQPQSSSRLPVVSIVTPSFNQAAYLEQAMLSVLEQDYPAIEYWIVDGGSSDGSLEIIERYSDRLTGWTSERDEGQTDAINKGFAQATGDIMAYLNSDDLYRPGAIGEAVEYLLSHPEMGMVYGDADYIDESGVEIGRFPAAQRTTSATSRIRSYTPASRILPSGSLARGRAA